MNGTFFSVNRCFVFGYLLPLNSKNADAGIRHRLLLAKLRPSERKLKMGPAFGLAGGKPADQMEEQLAAGLGEGQNERLRCIQLQRFKTFDQPVRPASPVHARLRSPCPGCRLRHADS